MTLELLRELQETYPDKDEEFYQNSVKGKCVFTTHTPVKAGHDHFPMDFVEKAIGHLVPQIIRDKVHDNQFNMTVLALKWSKHINGVAKKHEEVSAKMFPGYQIDAITNGVHSVTWTGENFQRLFDEYMPGWRKDSYNLRYALNIPHEEVWEAQYGTEEEVNRLC